MSPKTASSPQLPSARWLKENGPRELELLFRAIVYHPAAPVLIVDSDRNSREASTGAGKLLGLPREKIIGRKLDAFAAPGSQSEISEHWKAFLATGEQEGTLRLGGPDGNLRDVAYTAKGNVLPMRHVLVLKEKSTSSITADDAEPEKHRFQAGCRTTRFSWWMSMDGLSLGTPGQSVSSAIPPRRRSGNMYRFFISAKSPYKPVSKRYSNGPPPRPLRK